MSKTEERIAEIPITMFPLEVGNPCVFYSKGTRSSGAKPAVCTGRSNGEFVEIIEIRAGENHRTPDALRHIDDPALASNPRARQHGAWDYSPGVQYSFLVPGKFTEEHSQRVGDIPLYICRAVIELYNSGQEPSVIAGDLRLRGLTGEVIGKILQVASHIRS